MLKRLAYPDQTSVKVSAGEIASVFALIFEDRLSVVQTAALLTLLHSTGKDREADVIALCSHRMREAALTADKAPLRKLMMERGCKEGSYNGGLVSGRWLQHLVPRFAPCVCNKLTRVVS